jgi:hypothetical protein
LRRAVELNDDIGWFEAAGIAEFHAELAKAQEIAEGRGRRASRGDGSRERRTHEP